MRKPVSLPSSLLPSAASLRLTAYLGVVAVGAGLASAHALYADVREATRSLGRTLETFEDTTGDAETIRLNGAPIHRAGAFVDAPVAAVLDRYEDYCARNPNGITRALQAIPETTRAARLGPASNRALRMGIVRDGDETEGTLVCFVEDPSRPPGDLAARLKALVTTGDLSQFGRFRYVVARRAKGQTHVATMWADGELNVNKMFPSEGDAVGDDSAILPRPPEARRVVAASADKTGYGVRIYESKASVAQARAFYDAALVGAGWKPVDAQDPVDGRGYVRPDGFVAVVSVAASGERSVVSLVESGRGDDSATSVVRVEMN